MIGRALVIATALAATAGAAGAEPRRYALLIGANVGQADDVELRFAESDARGLADTLQDLGGFHADDVVVMTGSGADDVRTALTRINERIAAAAEPDAMLVVYYSGHGDAQTLHLSQSRLDMAELRRLVEASTAQARVLVIDACRSGALTRVKGGRKGPSFDINLDAAEVARGMVVVTSSAAGEDAQESDQLRGSFFTFYLRTALSGSADANGDDEVTLAEAYAYTKDATIAATSRTVVGPQHPTFEINLGGREDLVLTRLRAPGKAMGTLELPEAGWWLVFARDGKSVVAEVQTERTGHRLALRGGKYRLVQRRDDHLREGRIAVAAGGTTAVEASALDRVEYARVVRRGGSGRRAAWSMFATGGVRTEVRGLGIEARGDLGVRVDLSSLSLEARAAVGRSRTTGDASIETWGVAASVAAVRAFDVGGLTLGVGGELGGGVLRRRDLGAPRDDALPAFSLGPVVQAQLVLGRAYLRLDVAGLGFLVKSADTVGGAATFRAELGGRVGLGAGVYF